MVPEVIKTASGIFICTGKKLFLHLTIMRRDKLNKILLDLQEIMLKQKNMAFGVNMYTMLFDERWYYVIQRHRFK